MFVLRPEHRALLIEQHQFLFQEGKKRVLAQFTDASLDFEANQIAADSWVQRGKCFNPEIHDEGINAEQAENDGIWRYTLLSGLRDTMRLSLIAAIYHEWDKQLRDWLVQEMKYVPNGYNGEVVSKEIWKTPISNIWNLLKELGFDVRKEPYFKSLDTCRLVVNVYKHGPGDSYNDLKKLYPAFSKASGNSFGQLYSAYIDILVTDKDMKDFSDSIVRFWEGVPKTAGKPLTSKFPEWLKDAAKKGKKSYP